MYIKILDDLNPEDSAMLQALYSRSANSVDDHLEKVKSTGSGKFMQNYYVGYGHKSIADCGSTTIFIEGVSMLAAKAIQDWPLYSGQETSTRYIDMTSQSIVDPADSVVSNDILSDWMQFYISKQADVADTIRAKCPRKDGEDEKVYERAVKARTFDILRGFLPAGITTQLSWHTNLRQAGDHLNWMFHHPLQEVRDIAITLSTQLTEKYPSSGFDRPLTGVGAATGNDNERYLWHDKVASEFTYESPLYALMLGMDEELLYIDNLTIIPRYEEILQTRPRGCVLPHRFADLGTVSVDFLLDFGSYRDLQRHRNGVIRMPLLTSTLGFESWYLDQLGGLRKEAEELIAKQVARIDTLGLSVVNRQYYLPMGFRVTAEMTMALPSLLYFLELRSGKMVHPTLRNKVLQIVQWFKAGHPNIALHADTSQDDWDVRRGTQTITEKVE